MSADQDTFDRKTVMETEQDFLRPATALMRDLAKASQSYTPRLRPVPQYSRKIAVWAEKIAIGDLWTDSGVQRVELVGRKVQRQ